MWSGEPCSAWRRGRSLSALWLWYEDPTTSSAVAPILRWSKEVWLAATHPRGETGEHGQFLKVLNLPALRRIWERGRSQRPERWRSVRGPVGATFLSLDRIKWTWSSPFQFFDDNNTEILLTTTSPALLKSMLCAAVCRANQRQAAAKLADSSHFTGTRASLEVARRVANSKGGRLSRKESSSLRNAAVNAIWTKCRLKEAGYELETTLCDMCGQENDTLWHRIWLCRNPQVVAARNRFANTALQTEATREDVDLLWVTRAIIDDPSDHLPPPNDKDLAVNEEILDAEAWNLGTDHLWAYSDGSCTQELSREMKRASWGLIFYNSANKPIARYFGAIPAYLRQTSAAGEFAGLALALEVAPRDTSLVVDCKAVDHVWRLPLQKQLAASQVYAGVLLSSYRDQNRPNVQQVKWVKSHRTLDQATSAEEKQEIQRNDEADALAKAALQCHDDDTWEWAKQRARMEKTWMIAQTIGATVALWPRLGRVGLRSAPPDRAVDPKRCEMRIHQPHKWTFERKAWRCILCSRVAKRRTQHNRPPGKCPNERNAEHHDRFQLEAQRQGHVTWGAFHGSSPFFCCVRCGAHAGWCMRRLAQKCKGRPACDNGAWFRSGLLKGLHPKTGVCLGERAPVDLFLHRCGSALAPADALELDPRCAHRMRAVKKGPISCRCVLCSQTA